MHLIKGFNKENTKELKKNLVNEDSSVVPLLQRLTKRETIERPQRERGQGGGNTKESLEQLGVNRCGPPRPGHDQLHLLLPGRSRDRNGLEARRRGRSILYINIDTYAHMA